MWCARSMACSRETGLPPHLQAKCLDTFAQPSHSANVARVHCSKALSRRFSSVASEKPRKGKQIIHDIRTGETEARFASAYGPTQVTPMLRSKV